MSRYLNTALNVLSIALLLAGVALAASLFVPQFWVPSPTLEEGSSQVNQVSNTAEAGDKGSGKGSNSGSGDGPEKRSDRGVASSGAGDVAPESPANSAEGSRKETSGTSGPENKTLEVSIPEMGRVENDRVPNTAGDDEPALKKNVAVHLEGTGHPWQEEANVYLAGHRIGFPGTDSFLGFYRLDKLGKGDKIYLTDAAGKKYTYRVYRQEVVRPTNTSVTEPVPGRNILTLQTCTLPNYTQRLIVQAEKVA
ncbi:class E sortase [Rubrobacter aplysinae]|uniref:class E sortase n=1 Tax=Rubrobacter aplysinae TaxID=909625 RepID=UPI00069FE44E|nr:class E sortase [Rubrobacter aplysinae]